MKEDEDQYFLTDTATGQSERSGLVMRTEERRKSNEFLERQNSRWRWMSKADVEALNA